MRTTLLDSNGTIITANNGEILYSNAASEKHAPYGDELEQFMRDTKLNGGWIEEIYRLKQQLIRLGIDYDNFVRLHPFLYVQSGDLEDVINSGALIESAAGYSKVKNGVSGEGTKYFTSINFSTTISDINNFSFGLVVTTEGNAGSDYMAHDGTNYCGIQVRDSGTCTVRVGSGAAVTFANATAIGNYIVNVLNGRCFIYKNGVVQGSVLVSGSLPNYASILGGANEIGTPGDYSSVTYGCLWVYNGSFSSTQVTYMSDLTKKLMQDINRYY